MSQAKEMWNKKFSCDGYMYTKEPNLFLKQHVDMLSSAKSILFLGEGEGRNAVYAATLGHEVTAIDASDVGIEKTKRLAEENGVQVKTICADLNGYKFNEKYELIMSSFMHLLEPLRSKVFHEAMHALNDGGMFIAQFFSQKQIQRNSGGPKNLDLLYSLESLQEIFKDYNIKVLHEAEVELDEGKHHCGIADVIEIVIEK